jgi:hypothetical protein
MHVIAMVNVTEPTAPDFIPASCPADDCPRCDWVDKPAGLPVESSSIDRPTVRRWAFRIPGLNGKSFVRG